MPTATSQVVSQLQRSIARAIYGKEDAIQLALVTLLARGHLLIEAMNEAQVTVDVKTLPLPQPFLVIATQNPVEHHGTYPLPESQLDRFLMRIKMGYPSHE